MTQLAERAYKELGRLSEPEQDLLAEMILSELASDEGWRQSFAASQVELATLAREAQQEYLAGRTRRLNPDSL